jgi:uncharacterized membrane-anchored protein
MLRVSNYFIFSFLFFLNVFSGLNAFAQQVIDDNPTESNEYNEASQEIESGFHFEQGIINLKTDVAHIELPTAYQFLNADQTKEMLVNFWGEDESNAQHVGLISGKSLSVFSPGAIVFTVDYISDGHILEKNADVINHKSFLEHFQQSTDSSNTKRISAGLEPVSLNGWALKPVYNKDFHALYWIEDIGIGNNVEARLSANICVLGRSGYFRFSAVTLHTALKQLKNDIGLLAAGVRFENAHEYSAFHPSHEKASNLGLDALILGYTYPQAGILPFLTKYWKLSFFLILIFGLVFLGALRKKST